MLKIKFGQIALESFHKNAGDEAVREGFLRPLEDGEAFLDGEVVGVAGVHIDGATESGVVGAGEGFFKGGFGDGAIGFKRKKDGGVSFDFAAGLLASNEFVGGHRER